MTPDARNHVQVEDRGEFFEGRIFGDFTVERFNQQVDHITAACRSHQRDRLLIDVTQIKAELSLSDRFDIATHGAASATSIKVAMLSAPELIEPRKFGVLVAQNRGLAVEIFTDRKEAPRWLMAEEKPGSK